MRVRCPACAAPYFLPQVSPPDGPRCPNCDAPAPTDTDSPPRRFHQPEEPAGRSRVVTVVALLHLLVATGGLCMTVGLTAVTGELGAHQART
ncbi:hypothetical protein VT84_13115 [Gemmata sp. SH-PL17]|nr:hypothetical protein VT84_13115 [Gemmata sp. SH-PL17]